MFNTCSTPMIPMTAPIGYSGGNSGNGNSGWGDGNGWWVLIILFALFGGWGRGGYGDNGGSGSGSTVVYPVSADVQRGFDNQSVMNKLNGLEQGICSLGYDQLAQMNGINTNIMQTGFGIQNAIQQDTIANMQNTNAVSRQLADCCCENRAAIAQVRYDMATDTCATQRTVQDTGRAIIDNDNANWRSLDARLNQMEMSRKDERIAELQSLVNSLNLAQSQANQNNYLIQQLRPCPQPAYITCNPWGSYAPYGSCCSANNGCCNG